MLFSSVAFIFYFLPVFLAAYLASGLRTAVLLVWSISNVVYRRPRR